ncbi:MAG: carboxypeptidase regulatory-like domain-containing protein [Nitrospirae bacterium]|nr:carboxypeptidase regulatory-like domain-containing protein [Nitrospirota bacterium]
MAYEVIPVEKGGELSGTVKFTGDPQVNVSHQVVNNADYCGASVEEEKFIVGSGRVLQNVVISIEGVMTGKKPSNSILVIENKKCHFVPHVQVGMVGDVYEVRNSDPVLHNTHLHMEEATLLNIAMPSGGKNIKKTIANTGVINVRCDAHKFMQGWLVVVDNPYSAVSDREGRFRIADIPPGKYKVRFWHEGFQSKIREIEILPKKSSVLSIDFK